MNDVPIEFIKEWIEARDYAEANGLYDERLTTDQEMSLYQAVSTLSELSKETNSSLSELLKMGGFAIDKSTTHDTEDVASSL